MKVLILGGTSFLGRHTAEAFKNTDVEITLFHRGHTNPHLFGNEVQMIHGDRYKDIHQLKGQWDTVIDFCGYFPDNVAEVARHLSDHASHYIFISSCSVYNIENKNEPLDENSEIVSIDIDRNHDGPETYGARKYLCEQEVRAHFKGAVTQIRPGLIVGPYDTTFRFPYWVHRFTQGGEILAPGEPSDPIEFTDARDLAQWIVHVTLMGIEGVYNTVGPSEPLTRGTFLKQGLELFRSEASLTWVPEEFLRAHEVMCWSYLPLWVYHEIRSIFDVDSTLAISQGLKFRPIKDTLLSTQQWLQTLDGETLDKLKKDTLDLEREQSLIKEFVTN